MSDARIEVREVDALRVAADGRVGRLRVLGVADRDDRRIAVDACVADPADALVWASPERLASATARLVDPKRSVVGEHALVFASDLGKPEAQRRRAWLWIAEVDLLRTPGVPPVPIGRQRVPVRVRARYALDASDEAETKATVQEVFPVVEFDAGVLLVHGIGQQRRAQTLSQWSAALLRWINAWLTGVTDAIAPRLRGTPLAAWQHGLLVRGSLAEYDVDRVDRASYSEALVRKSSAPTFGDWRAGVAAAAGARTVSTSRLRSPTPDEREACRDVACTIEEEVGAAAVGGAAEFREAYVLDVGARGIDPSSVEMHVEAMAPDGYMLRSRWMLAESHWGESFWAPSFFGFGRWVLLTAPVVLVHYIAMARRQHRSALRWLIAATGLACGVALAQLAFVALMALWAVPWNRLRSAVLRIQMGLAGIVGDSYVLLADPVQRRAILDRVHRDLEWLAQRCRRVVVIAHSQGAAVAELVLSNRDDAGAGNIHAFATLGAGVQTLTAIQNLARSREVNVAGWVAIGCALLLGAALVVACTVAWQLGATVAAAALLGLVAAAIVGERAHPGRPKVLPGAARFRPWLDFFAAKDPVPYGPLVDPADAGENYRPKQVRNLDSWLADHTSYWQNPEQVVGPLAREIGRAAAFAPLERLMPDDEQALDRLERARLSRLGFLALARVATAIATALLAWAAGPAWLALGQWAFGAAQSIAGQATGASRPALAVWIEAATVLLPLLIHRALIRSTFDAWTTAEVERLLRRSAGAPATHWAATFALLLGLMLAGTAIYVWPLSPWQMLGATAVTAVGFVWLARRAHIRRVDGIAASPAPVRPSAVQS